MSYLKKKSDILCGAASFLHQEEYYPAVAHSAYYSCLQLNKHIWLHVLGKTEGDLEEECAKQKKGSHEVLINTARNYIRESAKENSIEHARTFFSKIGQLKRLRVDADYEDVVFGERDSENSIALSKSLLPLLKKYAT